MKLFIQILLLFYSCSLNAEVILKPLTQEEKHVIIDKGTERPFSGKYYDYDQKGSYYCKQCGAKLFSSQDKFHSGCGWPSFDDAITGHVKKIKDADGRRTEIVCEQCGAHLGHVFDGEGFTEKNRRYCVNSISLDFKKATHDPIKKAYFAGGCFWGVEYYLEKQEGVSSVVSGYMGGKKPNPTYRDVSHGNSGYLETVEVTYDSSKVNYETLAKLFFEIHDPTQDDGQGPDIGEQYHSAIFVENEKEKKIVQKLIKVLRSKGYDVVTEIKPKQKFFEAEKYHQNYYDRKGKKPYCHGYVKRF